MKRVIKINGCSDKTVDHIIEDIDDEEQIQKVIDQSSRDFKVLLSQRPKKTISFNKGKTWHSTSYNKMVSKFRKPIDRLYDNGSTIKVSINDNDELKEIEIKNNKNGDINSSKNDTDHKTTPYPARNPKNAMSRIGDLKVISELPNIIALENQVSHMASFLIPSDLSDSKQTISGSIRERSYIKIHIQDPSSPIEFYAVYAILLVNDTRVIIERKLRNTDKPLLIYKTTNRLPRDLIEEALNHEKYTKKTIIIQNHEKKPLTNLQTIANKIGKNNFGSKIAQDVITGNSDGISIFPGQDQIISELLRTIISGDYISITSHTTLHTIAFMLLNA